MSLRHNLLRNPLVTFLYQAFHSAALERKFEHLSIGRGSSVERSSFGRYVTIYQSVVLESCQVGDFTYISRGVSIAHATIGRFCSIGPNVQIGLGQHPTDFVSTHPIFFSVRKQAQVTWADRSYFSETATTTIGHDVWIGANAIIRDGLTIGHGAIIGAGAVVTKDVAPYAIVGGVPARLIKYRFAEDDIALLLKSQWWERSPEWLQQNFQAFHRFEDFRQLFQA